MKKIPTLFVRDPDDMSRVLPEVHPECGWVISGEGTATRKWDGTCVLFDDDGKWWSRRIVKRGRDSPKGFVSVETDENTGKIVGWEPICQSPFFKYWEESQRRDTVQGPGTFELIGPKINGNPEQVDRHWLVRHGWMVPANLHILNSVDRDFVSLQSFFSDTEAFSRKVIPNPQWPWEWIKPPGTLKNIEGIVYHHPDGRMAKIKSKDFP